MKRRQREKEYKLTNLDTQAREVVLLKSESSSWTTQVEASSEMSRGQVRTARTSNQAKKYADSLRIVKVDDILCLLESEREARRLR